MARGDSLLVNDNPLTKDTSIMDEFAKWHLFENNFIKNSSILIKDATIIDLDARYDFRPDRLAYEIYGQDFYYGAILIANNLGSMLQFKAEHLDYKCIIPSINTIRNIIEIPPEKTINILDNVNKLFAEVSKSSAPNLN